MQVTGLQPQALLLSGFETRIGDGVEALVDCPRGAEVALVHIVLPGAEKSSPLARMPGIIVFLGLIIFYCHGNGMSIGSEHR